MVDYYQTLVETQKDNSPGGVDAVFIPINDKWALKMFENENTRDSSYDIQQKCSEHGLAPEVGSKVDIEEGTHRYGFICEIVETVVPHEIVRQVNEWNKDDEEWDTEVESEWDYLHESVHYQLSQLYKTYENLGYHPFDMHVGNLGYLEVDGERRLICIDFGHW